ncbi:hypothetical protein DXG01_002720 [Tephrocybe rancida]|nr:hypothetical protein DXG01_002720 [Tephrocybe rancida]
MFSSPAAQGHLEAFALSYLQPGSALSTDDDPSPDDHGLLATALDVPPATHWSRDRTRRLSRTPTTHSLTGSLKSKAEPVPIVAAAQFGSELTPTVSQAGVTDGLRSRQSTAPLLSSTSEQKQQRRIALLHLITICCAIFGEGWNDGSNGPLLPAFQRQYNLGYLIVSLYFVSNCVGFVIGGALNMYLDGKIGFGKCVVIGTVFQLIAYVIQAPGPPFPVMVFANFITGFGLSLLNAQANGFVSSLSENMETKLGILHASYGLGAFCSPFAATYFSGKTRWSFHYLVSAGLTIVNIVALILVFRFRRIGDLLDDSGQASPVDPSNINQTPRENTYSQVFGLRAVHILTVFAVIYIGVEVTLGGWIVTFIIHERGGGHSSGYISSGFFGGLTLGRVGLLWFNKLVGEHRVIVVYTAIAIVLEITIWFVPSIIGNALAVSAIGLVLGPMFPVMVSHASKVLPRWLMTVCIGWITGIVTSVNAAQDDLYDGYNAPCLVLRA